MKHKLRALEVWTSCYCKTLFTALYKLHTKHVPSLCNTSDIYLLTDYMFERTRSTWWKVDWEGSISCS